MIPDIPSLQKNLDMTKDLGFMRANLDIRKYTDLSITEEAAKRLK
jgi:NitT/TauT family transport system substrate-binding protein